MDTASHGQLIKLARIDLALRDIEGRLANIPERRQSIETRRETMRSDQRRVEAEMAEIKKRRRELEQEAETLTGKLTDFDARLGQIKSNVEYQAMVKQIGDARSRRAESENETLTLMEREEELDSHVDQEKERIRDGIADMDADEQRLDEQLEDLERRRREHVAAREEAVEHLEASTRKLYERMASGRGGMAVVPVTNGACGGCFSALPPQRVNEVRQADQLVTCEACGRILVEDEAGTP